MSDYDYSNYDASDEAKNANTLLESYNFFNQAVQQEFDKEINNPAPVALGEDALSALANPIAKESTNNDSKT